MTELTKLLAFMSPWDRQATVRRYERRFDNAEDEAALIDQLGTPTSVAVRLAKDYVASPPPEAMPEDEDSGDEGEQLSLEELAGESEAPAETGAAEPEQKRRGAGYTVFAVVIGIPAALVLLALGAPLVLGGVWCVDAALRTVPRLLGSFNLFSDTLLTAGAGVAAVAVGVLLVWFGIWLGVSLCRAWVRALLRWGGRREKALPRTSVMAVIWRYVLYIVLGLLALAVLLAGAGWITGASLQRIGTVMGGPLDALRSEVLGYAGRVTRFFGV